MSCRGVAWTVRCTRRVAKTAFIKLISTNPARPVRAGLFFTTAQYGLPTAPIRSAPDQVPHSFCWALRDLYRILIRQKMLSTWLTPHVSSAISSCDAGAPACDLWAKAWASLLLWAAERTTRINEHPAYRRFDREGQLSGSPIAAQDHSYMSDQSRHRTPIALAEFHDPRGSGAHSRPQAHELSCVKAAI